MKAIIFIAILAFAAISAIANSANQTAEKQVHSRITRLQAIDAATN